MIVLQAVLGERVERIEDLESTRSNKKNEEGRLERAREHQRKKSVEQEIPNGRLERPIVYALVWVGIQGFLMKLSGPRPLHRAIEIIPKPYVTTVLSGNM